MTRVVRAELARLTRRRVLVGAGIAAVLFSAVASVALFLAVEPAATARAGAGAAAGRVATTEELAEVGGATQAFATGASFAGLLVFVTFIVTVAGEFSNGTFRTLLMRQPGRVRLLGAKTAALLVFVAAILIVAEVLTSVASTAMASSQGIARRDWFGLDGMAAAGSDYATALAAVSGWAILGTALGAIARSTPIALGVGIAWAGPFEHLVGDAWEAASRWFPGLLLEALAVGGTPAVSATRAALLLGAFVATAATVALALVARRDVVA